MLKVRVNQEKCIGSGRCEVIAAGTFRVEDEGKAEVVDPAGDDEETVRWAARECPVGAIIVEESPAGAVIDNRDARS